MPKNTVKKIISKFDEFFTKRPEGSIIQLSEVTYDSFMYKYGLQNVSEKKYKRFLIALRLYAEKDEVIKKFATEIGLIDEPK